MIVKFLLIVEVPVHSSHRKGSNRPSVEFEISTQNQSRGQVDVTLWGWGPSKVKTQWKHHEITRKGAKMSRIYVRDNVIGSPHRKMHSSKEHRKAFPWRFGWQRKGLFCEQFNMCDKKEITLKDVYIVWLYTIFKLRNSCKLQWVSKWCKQLTH